MRWKHQTGIRNESFDAGMEAFQKTFVSCQHKIHTISLHSRLFTHLKQPSSDKTWITSRTREGSSVFKSEMSFQAASLKGQAANIMMSNKRKHQRSQQTQSALKTKPHLSLLPSVRSRAPRSVISVLSENIQQFKLVSEKFNNTLSIVWLGYFHIMTMSHRHTTSQLQRLPRLAYYRNVIRTAQPMLVPEDGVTWAKTRRTCCCLHHERPWMSVSWAAGKVSHFTYALIRSDNSWTQVNASDKCLSVCVTRDLISPSHSTYCTDSVSDASPKIH